MHPGNRATPTRRFTLDDLDEICRLVYGEDIFYLLSEDASDRRVGFAPNCIEAGLYPVQVVGVLDKPPEVTNWRH